jgi:hypothetical protein
MTPRPTLIEPAEALQILLAMNNPNLAGKVTLAWFHDKQRENAVFEWWPERMGCQGPVPEVAVNQGPVCEVPVKVRGIGPPLVLPPRGRFVVMQGLDIAASLDEETKVAVATITAFDEAIRKLKIGLWGRPKEGKDREPILTDHQQEGSLNIWTEVFEGPFGIAYTSARCVRADVTEVFVSGCLDTKLRHPGDMPLLQEALHALADGKVETSLQAAKLVCAPVVGSSTSANVERLRKFIVPLWRRLEIIAKKAPGHRQPVKAVY